jgi:hypothetical protein
MGVRQPSIERSDQHLRFVRGHVCVAFESGECQGKIHAHHIRSAATAGTGIKPSDFDAVPLCEVHHRSIHDHGSKTFAERYKVDLTAIAEKFAKVSPYRVRAA